MFISLVGDDMVSWNGYTIATRPRERVAWCSPPTLCANLGTRLLGSKIAEFHVFHAEESHVMHTSLFVLSVLAHWRPNYQTGPKFGLRVILYSFLVVRTKFRVNSSSSSYKTYQSFANLQGHLYWSTIEQLYLGDMFTHCTECYQIIKWKP
jgi:hypothetical protein